MKTNNGIKGSINEGAHVFSRLFWAIFPWRDSMMGRGDDDDAADDDDDDDDDDDEGSEVAAVILCFFLEGCCCCCCCCCCCAISISIGRARDT